MKSIETLMKEKSKDYWTERSKRDASHKDQTTPNRVQPRATHTQWYIMTWWLLLQGTSNDLLYYHINLFC